MGLWVGIAGNQTARAGRIFRELLLPADFIAMSSDWGVAKPDPAFFRRIVDAAPGRPDEIVYVGDHRDNDLIPAKAAGLRAAHIRRGPWGHLWADDPRVAKLADWRITSLTELPGCSPPNSSTSRARRPAPRSSGLAPDAAGRDPEFMDTPAASLSGPTPPAPRSGDIPLLAMRGALTMRAAVLAARAGMPGEAADRIAEAQATARHVPEGVYHGTAFGPGSVRVHELALAVGLARPPQPATEPSQPPPPPPHAPHVPPAGPMQDTAKGGTLDTRVPLQGPTSLCSRVRR
jgi:hypothetical protein